MLSVNRRLGCITGTYVRLALYYRIASEVSIYLQMLRSERFSSPLQHTKRHKRILTYTTVSIVFPEARHVNAKIPLKAGAFGLNLEKRDYFLKSYDSSGKLPDRCHLNMSTNIGEFFFLIQTNLHILQRIYFPLLFLR